MTALLDPLDSQVVEDLRFTLGRDIQVVVAPTYQVQERLTKYYGADMANMDDVLKELSSVGGNGIRRGRDPTRETSILKPTPRRSSVSSI